MNLNYELTGYIVCTDVEDLVSYVSQFMELNAGDLILTGTPAGTGAAM
jgi:2-keto-4-pentenoate hydratase/2-oxohepta-3-ene-1,7-dioic acid hydratase in catechol pathway